MGPGRAVRTARRAGGASLQVDVKSPSVTHTLEAHIVGDWLNGGAKSSKEAVKEGRLKELLGF